MPVSQARVTSSRGKRAKGAKIGRRAFFLIHKNLSLAHTPSILPFSLPPPPLPSLAILLTAGYIPNDGKN